MEKLFVYWRIGKEVHRHENVPGFWNNWELIASCTSVQAAEAVERLSNIGVLPTYGFWTNPKESVQKSGYWALWSAKNNIKEVTTAVALAFLQYERDRSRDQ